MLREKSKGKEGLLRMDRFQFEEFEKNARRNVHIKPPPLTLVTCLARCMPDVEATSPEEDAKENGSQEIDGGPLETDGSKLATAGDDGSKRKPEAEGKEKVSISKMKAASFGILHAESRASSSKIVPAKTTSSSTKVDLSKTGASSANVDVAKTGASSANVDLANTSAPTGKLDIARARAFSIRLDFPRTRAASRNLVLAKTGAPSTNLDHALTSASTEKLDIARTRAFSTISAKTGPSSSTLGLRKIGASSVTLAKEELDFLETTDGSRDVDPEEVVKDWTTRLILDYRTKVCFPECRCCNKRDRFISYAYNLKKNVRAGFCPKCVIYLSYDVSALIRSQYYLAKNPLKGKFVETEGFQYYTFEVAIFPRLAQIIDTFRWNFTLLPFNVQGSKVLVTVLTFVRVRVTEGQMYDLKVLAASWGERHETGVSLIAVKIKSSK